MKRILNKLNKTFKKSTFEFLRIALIFLLTIFISVMILLFYITTDSIKLSNSAAAIAIDDTDFSPYYLPEPSSEEVENANVIKAENLERIKLEEQRILERENRIQRVLAYLRRKRSPAATYSIASIIVDQSAANGADYRVIIAIMGIESGFCNASFWYNCFGYLNGVKYGSYEQAFQDLVAKVSGKYARPYGWNFEGLACAVAGSFHKLNFVGGTGTNIATIGCRSGCGVDREGFAGNTMVAGGDIPFRIEAICSAITVEIYGSTLTGPPCIYDDHLQNFKVDDAGVFTDDTRDANNACANNACFFPACPAACDAALFGMNERFSLLKINTGTAGCGTYTVTWEYSRCGGWTALTDVTDGTTNFKTTGCQTVSYTIPDDWIATCVDCDTRYWIRARIDCGTTTTDPVMTQSKASLGGGIRLEQANAEMIRATVTNMDTVRVRNGALLKKSIIQCSVAPAKSAALDIGGADPSLNTIRDLTIQNNINGMLVKGTGCVTYNFRNILFSGNTQDLRVDFGMCDTVTINVLECGDSPSLCNVNCSTVTINNNVCVTVTVLDSCGIAVPDASVGIFDSPVCIGESALFCGTTNACGIFTASHSLMCDVTVSTRVRKKGFISTDTAGTIDKCGLCVPVTFITDNIVNLP